MAKALSNSGNCANEVKAAGAATCALSPTTCIFSMENFFKMSVTMCKVYKITGDKTLAASHGLKEFDSNCYRYLRDHRGKDYPVVEAVDPKKYKATGLNGNCWDSSQTKTQRDARCADDLVCARSGYDGRSFGGCTKDR